MTRIRQGLLIAGLVALGGCAPVVFTPASFSVGVAPGMGVMASQCSMLGGSPEAARLGVRSPAIQAASILNRIQRMQARVSAGYTAPTMEGWRRVASGEC